MGIFANEGSGSTEFEQLPPGSWNATCYKIVDLGTSMVEYKGDVNKRHEMSLFFEVREKLTTDGKPMSIFKIYTLSLHEKSALRQHLQQWRNKPFTHEELLSFDLQNVLGRSCKIEVEKNANGNSKIVGIYSAEGGSKKVPTVNECVMFDLEEYCKEWTGPTDKSKAMCDVFEGLPRFMQFKIAGDEGSATPPCWEVEAAQKRGLNKPKEQAPSQGPIKEFFDDDIPF
jgi:hypothetical protein